MSVDGRRSVDMFVRRPAKAQLRRFARLDRRRARKLPSRLDRLAFLIFRTPGARTLTFNEPSRRRVTGERGFAGTGSCRAGTDAFLRIGLQNPSDLNAGVGSDASLIAKTTSERRFRSIVIDRIGRSESTIKGPLSDRNPSRSLVLVGLHSWPRTILPILRQAKSDAAARLLAAIVGGQTDETRVASAKNSICPHFRRGLVREAAKPPDRLARCCLVLPDRRRIKSAEPIPDNTIFVIHQDDSPPDLSSELTHRLDNTSQLKRSEQEPQGNRVKEVRDKREKC